MMTGLSPLDANLKENGTTDNTAVEGMPPVHSNKQELEDPENLR